MKHLLVLLTDLFDRTGGIQSFNRALAKALDGIAEARGRANRVLVLNDRGGNPTQGQYLSSGRTSYVPMSGRRSAFVVESVKAARRADAVIFGHVHFTPILHLMRVVNPGLPAYLTVHGIEVWRRLPWLSRTGVLRVNRIFSVSAATAARMHEYNGVPRDRFSLLPNTLDPTREWDGTGRSGSRAEIGLPKGRMILSVSRLDEADMYKRIDLVIQAMPAILAEVPDAFYVVVGCGTDRQRLEMVAASLGLGDRVIFAGRVPDNILPRYYAHCDVFVLPSEGEGFGIVFLEAMRQAKPCVGVRAGGVPEVIDDGTTGFLADANDAHGVACLIIRLLRDGSLRLTVGTAGRARIDERFSFDMFRGRLESFLCA